MTVPKAWHKLSEEMGDRLLFGVPLANYSTLKVGGPAELMARVDSISELKVVLAICAKENLPYFVVGGGSNLLFSDEGFAGAVIKLGSGFKRIEYQGGINLHAGAGAISTQVVDYASDLGLGGLDGLAGVPGSIGGAVFMNAGSGDREVGRMVHSLTYLTQEGEYTRVSGAALGFAYRCQTGLPQGSVILGVEFNLIREEKSLVRNRVKNLLAQKASRQPQGVRSAGSVFKNPRGYVAGQVIDSCGLKGLSIGGAQVSSAHGNFIVNSNGQATSTDIRTLMAKVRTSVFEAYGIELEAEVLVIDKFGQKVAPQEW